MSASQQTAKSLILRTFQQWIDNTQQPPDWLMQRSSMPVIAAGLNEFNTLHLWLVKNVNGNADRNELVTLITRLQNMLSSWKDGFEARNVTDFTARVFQQALQNVLRTAMGFVNTLEESQAELADTQVKNPAKTLLSGPHQQVRRRAEQLDIEVYDWQAYRSQLPEANARNSANRVNLRLTVLPVLKGIVTAQRLVDTGIVAKQLGDYVLVDSQMILGLRTSWWLKELDGKARDAYVIDVLNKLKAKFKQEFTVMCDKAVTDDCGYTFIWIAPSAMYTSLRRDVKTQVLDWSLS